MIVLTIAGAMTAKGPTGEAAKSGPWGLAIILILCAACYFLFKSMSKHMRRVREDFPTRDSKPDGAADAKEPGRQSPAQQADSSPDGSAQVRPDGSADDGSKTGDGPVQP